MKRGDVWWSDQPPPVGRRPFLLIARDSSYGQRGLVIVAHITTRVRGLRAEVRLTTADGMPRDCVANLDTINTIPQAELTSYIATLDVERMAEVDDALHYSLGLRA
ncbi:MAG: hypothetical protein GEU80_15040 [Dehalococcoidia bacterium]|nr:hypothetical protein [Dehalococcoidia bacterium]